MSVLNNNSYVSLHNDYFYAIKDQNALPNESTVARQLFKSLDLMSYVMEFLSEYDKMVCCLVNATCVAVWLKMPIKKHQPLAHGQLFRFDDTPALFNKYRVLALKNALNTRTNIFDKFANCIIGPEPYYLTEIIYDNKRSGTFLCFKQVDDDNDPDYAFTFYNNYINSVYSLFNYEITEKHWCAVIANLSYYTRISCESESLVLTHALKYLKSRNFDHIDKTCRGKDLKSSSPRCISLMCRHSTYRTMNHDRHELRAMGHCECSRR